MILKTLDSNEMNIIKNVVKLLFLSIIFININVYAESLNKIGLKNKFETADSSNCENGFNDPKSEVGKITEVLKNNVKFNTKKKWMHTFEYCTFAISDDHKYIIRNYFVLDSKSAFYVIFDYPEAYAIYGDYDVIDGKWFYRDAYLGKKNKKLKKILEEFLIKEKWLDK